MKLICAKKMSLRVALFVFNAILWMNPSPRVHAAGNIGSGSCRRDGHGLNWSTLVCPVCWKTKLFRGDDALHVTGTLCLGCSRKLYFSLEYESRLCRDKSFEKHPFDYRQGMSNNTYSLSYCGEILFTSTPYIRPRLQVKCHYLERTNKEPAIIPYAWLIKLYDGHVHEIATLTSGPLPKAASFFRPKPSATTARVRMPSDTSNM